MRRTSRRTRRRTPPPARRQASSSGVTGIEFVVSVHGHQRFTAARSFAERDRGLRSSSSAEGVTALRVNNSKGQRTTEKSFSTSPEKLPLRKNSSPAGLRASGRRYHQPSAGLQHPQALLRAIFSASISPLTSMRSAWKSLVRNFASPFGGAGLHGARPAARVDRLRRAGVDQTVGHLPRRLLGSPQSPRMRVRSSAVKSFTTSAAVRRPRWFMRMSSGASPRNGKAAFTASKWCDETPDRPECRRPPSTPRRRSAPQEAEIALDVVETRVVGTVCPACRGPGRRRRDGLRAPGRRGSGANGRLRRT